MRSIATGGGTVGGWGAILAAGLVAACGGGPSSQPIMLDSGNGTWPGDTVGVLDGESEYQVPADLGTGCLSDDDCAPYYCQPKTSECVACLINSHCPKGYKCQLGQCIKTEGACISDPECTAAGQICDPDSGVCVDCIESADCDTGKYCLQNKCLPWKCTPNASWCEGSVAKVCNDEGSGVADEKDCNDLSVCTAGDACFDGVCAQTTAKVCDDENACTQDDCDPVTGCHYVFLEGPCDDGSVCTSGDHCQAGSCVPGELTCDCVTDLTCQEFENSDLCDGTLVCIDAKCVTDPDSVVECAPSTDPCMPNECKPATGKCVAKPSNDGIECDDGDACTAADQCQEGECIGAPAGCSDDNECTKDFCKKDVGCLHEPVVGDCNDGDPCTWPDVCMDGVCIGSKLDCEDGNPCTKNYCEPGKGCQVDALLGPCQDGSKCTTGDTCVDGVCKGQKVECKDSDPCTDDLCDPAAGCSFPFNKMPCDDGNICTLGDHCSEGKCVAGADLLDCNDGNPCTTDSCEIASGECKHANNSLACDDADPCTVGDVCSLGSCKSGAAKDCDDDNACTEDKCDAEGNCKSAPLLGSCDDGNKCTTNDLCVGGQCQPGKPVSCKDSNPCTDESCDPAQGCVTTNNSAVCNDNDTCTQTDVCTGGECKGSDPLTCKDSNPCTADSCSPGAGCQFLPSPGACDDKNSCTKGDYCAAGTCLAGAPETCDDANVCTSDSCDSQSGCVFTPNTKSCDDGVACTFFDKCAGGVCAGGPPQDCDDGNVCTEDSCGDDFCLHSPVQGVCDDGEPCTISDSCSGGMCIGVQVSNCGCHSLLFDGATGYGTVAYSPVLDLGASYTIECWWKQGADGAQVLVSQWNGPGSVQASWRMEVTAEKKLLFRHMSAGNQGQLAVTAAISSSSTWHHGAAVLSGGILRLYLDGALIESIAASAPAAAAVPVTIGAGYDANSGTVKGYFKGNIDEVRISNAAVYSGNTFVPPPHLTTAASTVALWGADQQENKVLFDLSTNYLHMWLGGGTQWSNDTPAKVCTPLPNYPPSQPGVSIQPPAPSASDNLLCSVDSPSVDKEGDQVTYSYQWAKNGAAQPGQISNTLSEALTSPCPAWQCNLCEVWSCTVTPSDGKPGYPTTASTTIGKSTCQNCDGQVFGGHCYKLFNPNNFGAGSASCQGWGGQLVTISNAQENAFVSSLCGAYGYCWIGLNDMANENQFVWVSQEPVAYLNFMGGEPNNVGNEDCVQICSACGNQTGGWNDNKCNANYAYICEK